MKPVYRPFFYEKYLHLLEDNDKVNQLPELEEDVDQLMKEIKNLGFLQQFYPIILLVLLPLIFLTLAMYIKVGFSFKLPPVVLLLFFLLYKRVGLLNLLEELKKPEGSTIRERLMSKLNYAAKGIEIKAFRVDFLRTLYIAFFPFVLYLFAELFFGPYSNGEAMLALLFAYLLSTPLWWYYFTAELVYLEPIQKDIQELSKYFYSI